jgi:hypothetical protein
LAQQNVQELAPKIPVNHFHLLPIRNLVTTTISPPIRILAIVGVLVAVGVGIVLFTHNRSASSSSSEALPPVSQTHSTPATKPLSTSSAKPTSSAMPASKPAAKPKIALLPGLPSPVAHALHFSKVVVFVVYARGGNGDLAAVEQARAGAKSAHAGFAAVNILDEKSARTLNTFAGTATSPPAVFVVKRPGKIVNQFSGSTDSGIVEQAALNAGAGH